MVKLGVVMCAVALLQCKYLIADTLFNLALQDVEEIFPQFISDIDASGKDRGLTPDGKIKRVPPSSK